jgi:hypothetical protein
VSPKLRQTVHQLVDVLLDAIAEEGRQAVEDAPRKRRKRPAPVRAMPQGIDEFTVQRALAAGRKAGLF